MTKQPEALKLADALDELDRQFSRNGLCGDAAHELRRLHEVEGQRDDLLAALRLIETDKDGDGFVCAEAMEQIRAAIDAVTED